MLARSLMALTLAFIRLDGVLWHLQGEPHTIKLHDSRSLSDRFTVGLPAERLQLINTFIDRPQAHTAAQHCTPLLTQMAQTLGESKAYERTLIQIQPQALKFLQDRVVANTSC